MKISYSFLELSRSGFIPAHCPAESLSSSSELNHELNSISQNLPSLLREKILRSEIIKLNSRSNAAITLENNTAQINLAMLMLTMIAQAYIWEDADKPADVIPAIISKNLHLLCEDQRLPTLTYADYVLANWRKTTAANSIGLDNIEPLFTFTGTSDEAWFIKIHVAIEAECHNALQAAYQATFFASTYLSNADINELINIFNTIADSIQASINLLKKMIAGCNPHVYWFAIRPYLNGWERVQSKATGKYEGVKFDGVYINNQLSAYRLKGASGAQSSIIPALDALFGIQHDADDLQQTMLAFQQYMPRAHVQFIEFLQNSGLKKLMKQISSRELAHAWENAIAKLGLFRLEHINLVKQYIYNPAESRGIESTKIIGTGGSSIEDYLGKRYASTQTSSSVSESQSHS